VLKVCYSPKPPIQKIQQNNNWDGASDDAMSDRFRLLVLQP